MPLVEVFVATYPGHDRFIGEMLESIKAQTFTDYELRVVRDNRLDQPKYNEALDACQSKYIAFPHSDDVYHPDWLKESIAKLEANPNAVACFSMDDLMDEDGRRKRGGTRLPIKEQDTYSYETIVNAMLVPMYGNFLRCQTVVFNRALVGDKRYPDRETSGFGTAADTAFWFMLLKDNPICIVNKPMCKYREHFNQGSQSQRTQGATDHWEAMEYAVSIYPDLVDCNSYLALNAVVVQNKMLRESAKLERGRNEDRPVTMVVAHEPPYAAGTGVVAAERVKAFNKQDTGWAVYVYPDAASFVVMDGFERGVPVCKGPPDKFQAIVKRLKPEVIEFHHTMVWGDKILAVESNARKFLFLHDLWMFREHPHKPDSKKRTVEIPEDISIMANSEYLREFASKELSRNVTRFVPPAYDQKPVNYRKRVGFFGYWNDTKGIDLLIKAWRKIPDCLLVLFCAVPQGFDNGRGLYGYDNILIFGPWQRHDLKNLVHLIDEAILPSRFESYGMIKRELESLGVKVLATNTGGMGGTIEPNSVDAIVEAVRA